MAHQPKPVYTAAIMNDETVIWKSSPSQLLNLGSFSLSLLIVAGIGISGAFFSLILPAMILPFLWAGWKWLTVKCRVYELTSQRLRLYEGVLNRKIDEIELYRVKDTNIEQPFFLRLFGLGVLNLKTSDRSHADVALEAISDVAEVKLGSLTRYGAVSRNGEGEAVEGLVRVDDIIIKDVKISLDRDIVEEAFRVKWDLLLIQDKLTEAISVCKMLLRLYPDSPLVDQALFKIAVARQENGEYPEALRLLRAVTALPKSSLKPEAQFTIASIYEQQAMQRAEESGRPPSLKSALSAYLQCAERYPTSAFAGDSLAKICNFYISTRDYNRAIELLERIFQDYPYAGFLDQMLMKWALVSYKMEDYDQAHKKVEQLLSEYPGSKLVNKAKKFLTIIEKKID